ncbi:hypothetical protein ABQF34_24775 [Mycolicibacterium boenickei]
MTKQRTPLDAATAVLSHPTLPTGADERFVGFGVMGFPFASGHYLALRYFPATTFSPGYRSVWHRDPGGTWTFYATTPGQQSCARYFSSATPNDAVQCDIDVAWVNPWSLFVGISGLLSWTVDIRSTAATRLVSAIGRGLPVRSWTNPAMLGLIGRAAGSVLRAGTIQLAGTAPNGQNFMIAPTQVWLADGSATLAGTDLGPPGPLDRQAVLADFRPPQRGIFVVGSGHFDTFDATRHQASERTVVIDGSMPDESASTA